MTTLANIRLIRLADNFDRSRFFVRYKNKTNVVYWYKGDKGLSYIKAEISIGFSKPNIHTFLNMRDLKTHLTNSRKTYNGYT